MEIRNTQGEDVEKLNELKRVVLVVIDDVLERVEALGKTMLNITTAEDLVRKEGIAKNILDVKKVRYQTRLSDFMLRVADWKSESMYKYCSILLSNRDHTLCIKYLLLWKNIFCSRVIFADFGEISREFEICNPRRI